MLCDLCGFISFGPRASEDRFPVQDRVPQQALIAAIEVAMQRVEVERDDAPATDHLALPVTRRIAASIACRRIRSTGLKHGSA